MRVSTSDMKTRYRCSSAAPPLQQSLADPVARAAAIAQLCSLPWEHPNAVQLRRLFREAEARVGGA